MAKDSFILYKSFYKPISRLSDKQLGRLFRAIYLYQIDGEATVEEDIEMTFEFFKNQFELDESKYQGIVERNRSNGRKGVAADETKQPKDSKSAKTAQWHPNNPVAPSGTQWGPNNPMAPKQPSGDYNDNDKDLKENYVKEKAVAAADVVRTYFDDSRRASLEQLMMTLHVGMEDLQAMAKEFVNDWGLSGRIFSDMTRAHSYLTVQIKEKALAWLRRNGKQPQAPAIPREHWAARIERRSNTEWVVHQLGSTEPIPVGTPDPPSHTHVWYNGQWVHQ